MARDGSVGSLMVSIDALWTSLECNRDKLARRHYCCGPVVRFSFDAVGLEKRIPGLSRTHRWHPRGTLFHTQRTTRGCGAPHLGGPRK